MALAGVTTVFVDDGGVLNDNERRAPQWRRLLGEYLVPRLGGTPEAWAIANTGVFERAWARYMAHLASAGSSGGVDPWVRADRARWLADMCAEAGVAPPRDLEGAAVDAIGWVSERVRAEIPGAVDAVRKLAARGLVLHTASGGLSWELEPYLRGMGIRDLFSRLYGPDLVDRFKNGPHYYEAILAHSGTEALTAVAVDDGPDQRRWAAEVGLRAFSDLSELLAALD